MPADVASRLAQRPDRDTIRCMRPTIFLFDIDGTLLSSGGAGRRAMETAFSRAYDRADACSGFSFAGMTDRAIVRQARRGIDLPDDEAAIDLVIALYLDQLGREVARAEDYRVHAGMHDAVAHCLSAEGVAVGLGTGNVEAGARIKLARAGLHDRFAFGGFGSDHEDRGELLRIGAERGAARLGHPRAACRVVVIGDTPRDVSAARAIDAEAIAVATGPFSVDELAACEPDAVYSDLSAPGALVRLLSL